MHRNASLAKVVVSVGFVGLLAGCGSPEEQQPVVCPQDSEIRGACAGVPQAAVCDGATCTANVTCAKVIEVMSDAELQQAAMTSMAGSCIALAPGKYGAVTLPGGVSLLGPSAAQVTVGTVTLSAGAGSVVRGLTTSVVHVAGATGARIESVHVTGSSDTGVLVDASSSVSLVTSTIEGSARFGLHAVDALSVSLDRVIIAGSGAAGVWVASSSDCVAGDKAPVFKATSAIVRGNHIAGVAIFGAKATMKGVDILGTLPGDMVNYGVGGGGLSVANCASVDARGLRVHDSNSYGVLVDGSAATLGGTGPDEEVEIHRNLLGLSVQHVKDAFKLENAQLEENLGFGIGLSGESKGIIICRSKVSGTKSKTLPTVDVAVKAVGDGLVWTEKASATITDLSVSASALASVLIDGEASGKLDKITLSGGDQDKGIVQQNFSSGAQPTLTGGTPSPQVVQNEVHPVPIMPSVLPKNL